MPEPTRSKTRGQAFVETLVVLFTISILLSAAVQLLWIFALQQLVQAAAIYAAKDGARSSLDPMRISETYVDRLQRIPGIEPYMFSFEVLQPLTEHRPMTAGFDRPRMAELDSNRQEKYLRSRILTLEFTHCLDLKTPLVRDLLSLIQRKQTPLASCQHVPWFSHPFFIQVRATVPLETALPP
ncbi:hypothetical protein CWE11_09045 [Aliidiomarina sanyensis]|uniref:Pilus assembly protein TadE n=2 Tax=Aliidiomarina sanyensis TaxID=1249555 RepID=A0A432WDR7_9GAMM|nr:hypothetical protein CWE11_09045 [Aliidiomarina sanyensis]